MKKIITLTAVLLAFVTAAIAQIDEHTGGSIDGRVTINNVQIDREGDKLQVEYSITVPKRAVKRGRTMLFSPYFVSGSGEFKQSLSPVVVRGRGTRIAAKRGEWVDGLTADSEDITYLRNGQTTTLTTTVPFQEWMYGSQLFIDAVEGGCCSYGELADVPLNATVPVKPLPQEPVVPVTPIVPEPAEWVPLTLADSLSTAFPFVLPSSEYDATEPFKIYDDERDNALVVYYYVGKYNLVPDYMDNAYTLSSLVNVIRMIMESDDSRVDRVVVAGFASPEGGFALNDRLAFERAVTIKKHIMDGTGLADQRIELYNGSEDWRGLRAMVAKSNLPEKQRILDILDNTPVWDGQRQTGKEAELMRLDGGKTYRYLLREYFPYLRSGAFIRVYYNND